MPIKARPKDISVHTDPLSLTASLQILQGKNVQTYNVETNEYEPDRTGGVNPCEICPVVVIHDPEGVMTGTQPISSCEWYEGTKLISEDANYEMKGTSLFVRKNVPQETPVEIRCVFTFTDVRTNTVVQVERSMPFYTAVYDDKMLRLAIDKPKGIVVDPMTLKETAEQPWIMSISAQLYSGKMQVPDNEAAYLWQVFDRGTQMWRDFSEREETVILKDTKDGSGHWKKVLKIDMRFVEQNSFRCFATQYKGEYPTKVTDSTLVESVAVKVDIQHTIRAEVFQTAGMKINTTMDNPVTFECMVSNQYGPVPKDRLFLFRIRWYAKSAKPGSKAIYMGEGKTMTFVPKDYGFDNLHPIAISAEVGVYKMMAPIINELGTIITSSDKVLISTIYK